MSPGRRARNRRRESRIASSAALRRRAPSPRIPHRSTLPVDGGNSGVGSSNRKRGRLAGLASRARRAILANRPRPPRSGERLRPRHRRRAQPDRIRQHWPVGSFEAVLFAKTDLSVRLVRDLRDGLRLEGSTSVEGEHLRVSALFIGRSGGVRGRRCVRRSRMSWKRRRGCRPRGVRWGCSRGRTPGLACRS